MKTHATALLLFLFSIVALQAQQSSFFIGASGGGNLSKFKYSEDLAELYPSTSSVFGLNGGAILGFEIQNFTISSGIQYIQKGGEYRTDNFEDESGTGYFTGREKLHYLSIPVLVGYRKYLTDNFALSFTLGPSFNVGLKGKLDEETQYYGTDETEVQNYTISFGNGLNDDYRATQIGFQVSPGLVFAINNNSKLTFNVTWDSGTKDAFNPRYKDANDFFDTFKGEQRNKSTIFSVGYEYHFKFGDRY
ncbi:MAG: PorT family protein [Phaeodactylibacter sp.]|nr:PorT family protein [Phaeodactylibacter sp.]MCB9275817.1 PorT family protein [Lewinellaceae bacterium]